MLNLLTNIGLTEAEAKVYLALLNLGTSTVGPITEKSKVSYSKIYLLLEKLIDKGLVSHIIKNKTKHFSASNPKKILEYLDQKKSDLESLKKETKIVLPTLQAKLESLKETETITIYEGYEGLKSIYEECLDTLKKDDEILVLGASLGINTNKQKYQILFEKINQLRLEKDISYRIIFNEEFKNEKGVKFWKKQRLTKVKFLMNKTPASINIQYDKVLIIYWHKEEAKVFAITSSIVADSLESILKLYGLKQSHNLFMRLKIAFFNLYYFSK